MRPERHLAAELRRQGVDGLGHLLPQPVPITILEAEIAWLLEAYTVNEIRAMALGIKEDAA